MRTGKAAAARVTSQLLVAIVAMLATVSLTAHAASATRTSAFEYDPTSGLLVKEIVEPGNSVDCLVTTYVYDGFGNKTGATTRNCNGSPGSHPGINSEAPPPVTPDDANITARSSGNTFTPDGRFVATSTNALNQSETKVFDPRFGGATKLTGPNALTTEWAYDRFGRKTLEKRVDGNGTKWTYQYCTGTAGGTAACPTINGAVGAYVITTTPVAGYIDLVAGTTGAQNGPAVKVYFDKLNREIRTETQGYDGSAASQAIYKDTWYDANGNVSQVSNPYYAGMTSVYNYFEYDVLGRVMRRTWIADDGQVVFAINYYEGLTTRTTNPASGAGAITKNVVGQIATVTDTMGKTLTHKYDPFGNLAETTDPLGNVTRFQYDTRGRKILMQDPDMGTWRYGYNVLGELVRQTNPRNEVTVMSYDVLGRMTGSAGDNLSRTWTYDRYTNGSICNKCVGKLTEASSANGYLRRIGYHLFNGRPIWLTETVGGVTYSSGTSYDSNGRVAIIGYPGGALSVNHIYTPLGYLKEVRNNANNALFWRADAYDAAGHVINQIYGNNVRTSSSYSTTGRMLSNTALTSANSKVHQDVYTYDAQSNLKTITDQVTGIKLSYGYDALNRMTSEARSGGTLPAQTITYTYDEIGNVRTRTEGSTTLAYNYPPSGPASVRPHAVSGITGTVNGVVNPAYAYDATGSMISATGRDPIVWSTFDKVASIGRTVSSNNRKVDYLYNVDYQRVRETYSLNGVPQRTTTYLNPADGAGLIYEEETGPAVAGGSRRKHYINGGSGTVGVLTLVGTGTTATWETRYWHKNHVGSTIAVTNESGATVEKLAYEPFGKRRQSNGTTDPAGTLTALTDRGYTGHEMMDEVGLINMNGRIYDPAIARFMSADPYVQSPMNTQSYNRYAYAFNSPMGYVDPSGHLNLGRKLSRAWKSVWHSEVGRTVLSIVAAYFTYGAAYEWGATSLIGSVEGSLSWSATGVVSASGPLGVASGAIGGASAGFVGSLVASGGSIKGAMDGTLSGAISGGLAGFFGDTYSLPRVFAETVAGGVTGRIYGRSFADGMRSALYLSGATYIAVNLRDLELEHSRQIPGQVGESPGFRGRAGKLGGARVDISNWIGPFDPNAEDYSSKLAEYYARVRPSYLGGHQGQGGCLLSCEYIRYSPGSLVDNVVEAYAGVHDALNHPFFYNSNGTAHAFAHGKLGALGDLLGQFINGANVVIATPMVAASAVPEYARFLFVRTP